MGDRHFPPPWSVEENDARFIVKDANRQALAYVYFEDEPGRRAAALFGLFAQDDAGMRVHVMYLMTYRTSHRLTVFRGIFGNKALNAVSDVGAPPYKERHAGIAQREGQAVETLTAL